MVVKVSKPEINVREKISELDKPSGTAGEAMLRAETPQEQQSLIGISNRNIIINGDFQVSQRGTSYPPSSTAAGYQTVDRFRNAHGGLGGITQSLTESGPSFAGHRNSYKMLATSAVGSVPAGADPWLKYEVESRDIECLNLHIWKKELTLSFWIRTNKPGQHSISMNSGNFSGYVYTVPYNISGTEWQKVTVVFPPPPGNMPSGVYGLRLYWSLGAGSSYQHAYSATNKWITGVGKYEVEGNTRIAGVNNAYIEIAGVQLELGSVATPFKHRSYGEELALCQRYCIDLTPGSAPYLPGTAAAANTTVAVLHLSLPTTMRAVPSLSSFGSPSNFRLYNGGTHTVTTYALNGLSPVGGGINFVVSSGLTVGQAIGVYTAGDFRSLLDAELP